jgi:hypothetical protein
MEDHNNSLTFFFPYGVKSSIKKPLILACNPIITPIIPAGIIAGEDCSSSPAQMKS